MYRLKGTVMKWKELKMPEKRFFTLQPFIFEAFI